MKVISKALEIIGIGSKENTDGFQDDYFEDDFDNEQPVKSSVSSERPARSGRYPKRDVLDDDSSNDSYTPENAYASRQTSRLSRLSAIRGGADGLPKTMVIHTPKSYTESQSLAMLLKQNKQIIVKFDAVETDVAQRILDFMSGASFAMDCNVEKICGSVYLFVSNDIAVERQGEEPPEIDEADGDDGFYTVDNMRRK